MPTQHLKQLARQRIPDNIMIEGLPRRDRWLLYIAYPGRAARYLHVRFRAWTVQPGEVWENWLTQKVFVIRTVKPTWVEAEVWSCQLWEMRGKLRDDPRCEPCIERRSRDEMRWWSPTGRSPDR